MKPLSAALALVAVASVPAMADDLSNYIVEQAATCWTTPTALRGVHIAVTFDVRFRRDGHVDLVQVVAIQPEDATSRALAIDMAGALQRCGPYVTEGMQDITLTMEWPL